MVRVNVRNDFDSAYIRRFAATNQQLRRHMELRGLAVRTQSQMRLRSAPRRIDTGNLINSIQILTYYQFGAPVVRIGTSVEYALFVHEGTSPHVIRPRRARALSWVDGGTRVFAKRVNHPGMQANPFLRDGLARGMAEFR